MRHEVALFLHKVKNSIRIPAGTKPTACRGDSCTNARVYFVDNKPVSVEPYGANPPAVEPTATEDGAGISHFADCPDAVSFHRKGKR